MAQRSSKLQQLQNEKRGLEFKLIEVNFKIKALTPVTLEQHLEFNRNRSAREQQLKLLEAERDALNEQIGKLDKEIVLQEQLARVAKAGAKQPPKKKEIHERVEQLMDLHKGKKKSELFSMIADERGEADEAVKKAYYDYEKDLQGERNRKAEERKKASVNPPTSSSKEKKLPKK